MAEVIQDSIRLVSFASDECTKSHAHTVCDLGHRLELVQNDTWLDYHEDSPGNTIVLIENKSFVQSNLLHSFDRSCGAGLHQIIIVTNFLLCNRTNRDVFKSQSITLSRIIEAYIYRSLNGLSSFLLDTAMQIALLGRTN